MKLLGKAVAYFVISIGASVLIVKDLWRYGRLEHEFVSIPEEEWKLGRSRYLCADCGADYSEPIHTTK